MEKLREYIKRLRERWAEMSEKEQKICSLIAFVVIVVIFYFVFVFPVQHKIAVLKEKSARYESDYQTIASYSTAQKNSSTAIVADLNTTIESAVDKIAKEHSLSVSKMVRSGKNVVSLEIEKIDSVDLFTFLEELEKKYAVFTEGLDIVAIDSQNIKVKRLVVGRSAK